jgi:serine/threonine protein kinase
VTGLKYLHELDPPIVHGNLNAVCTVIGASKHQTNCLQGNIFFGEKHSVKLGEFGLAMLTQEFLTLAPSVLLTGICRWMSPELLESKGKVVGTIASDIWALGCTMYEVSVFKV